MESSTSCAASGSFLLFGGFAGVMWVLMRAVSLHLQICWGVVVGRGYMWFSQATAWLIPVIIVTLSLIFSGVSFRFGQSCHINHKNSLSDFWIPLLIMSSSTLIIQLGTFGYCLKVYLASLSDNSATTEGSSLPYTSSVRTVSPRQAFRRIRRVLQLQWRGIVIVLIIIADVIFFTVVFVWQDKASEDVKRDPALSKKWIQCLATAYANGGDKNDCLEEASKLVMSEAIVTSVLLLMAVRGNLTQLPLEARLTHPSQLNGVWLMLLLGRWSMFTGWAELFRHLFRGRKKEFVSVDARYDMKKEQRSYEMLSRDSSAVVTPLSPAVKSPASPSSGMRTPDYFGRTARYNPPPRSFSNPRPPQSPPPGVAPPPPMNGWDSSRMYTRSPPQPNGFEDMNPLGMNRI